MWEQEEKKPTARGHGSCLSQKELDARLQIKGQNQTLLFAILGQTCVCWYQEFPCTLFDIKRQR